MSMATRVAGCLGSLLMTIALWPGMDRAQAAEIQVLSAGAVRAIVTDFAASFRQETGHTATLTFGTVGVMRQKLSAGDAADVVSMTDIAIDEIARQGAVTPGARADSARTGKGSGVREGGPAAGAL